MVKTVYQHTDIGKISYAHIDQLIDFRRRTKSLALKYVLAGRELYEGSTFSHKVKQEELLLLPYDTVFEGQAGAPRYTEGLCISIPYKELSRELEQKIFDVLLHQCWPSRSSRLGILLSRVPSMECLNSREAQRFFYFLKYHLQKYTEEIAGYKRKLATTGTRPQTQETHLYTLLAAKDWVYKHYRERITLERLSKEVGMSKFQLLRLFKRCFGHSPAHYQEGLRMQHALSLYTPSASITQIALYLGYPDLASFSKKFKRYYGASPSLYLPSEFARSDKRGSREAFSFDLS